ncbi:MAG TPA: hypothetical protein VGP99_05745 [Tepidisphaeraceae bacterium]|jgi:hypothetical protein|nr:hypothetical protein [Tepidisphaeraceae bacterium]
MSLRILCSGYLIRYPLGGFSWHHLQYLLGFRALGHKVTYVEHFGWANSCYDPSTNLQTSNPQYGLRYFTDMLERVGFQGNWCFLAEDGMTHGMQRSELADACTECDIYFNLSNMNWIAEFGLCRRRVLIDTDPAFTQIGFGMGGPFSRYHRLFTYGENVHKRSSMPTAGEDWLPTRQPVVLTHWKVKAGDQSAPFTTIMNWSSYREREHEGRVYGQKNREFPPYYDLPQETHAPMEIAIGAPPVVSERLLQGGWTISDPREATRTPHVFQLYVARSRAEFSVAKHAYVSTRCGWFSDRSACYLASGRPVVLQDTGFSDVLPCGMGLLSFGNTQEAKTAIASIGENYKDHCHSARKIAEEYFDSNKVLGSLLERCL